MLPHYMNIWLFFKLLRLIEEIFEIDPKETSELIKPTNDGLGLQLLAGKHTAIKGIYHYKGRDLCIKFNYNRTFSHKAYPSSGSWTQQMIPDYTLSLWPKAFTENKAEEQEIIVHIHFDAKYKVQDLKYLIDENVELLLPDDIDNLSQNEQEQLYKKINEEKQEQKEGNYKRADLLKMHAYKDAIRRTAGAYILYPGTKQYHKKGFHEVVPGLGAFPVSPSNDGQGLSEVKSFIFDVLEHYTDRASRREELSFHTYEINKNKSDRYSVHEAMPELYNGFRFKPPQDITVLVGYYNNTQYSWITEKHLYNIRIDKKGGLEKYSSAELEASYLLLHGKGELITDKLWKITSKQAILMSKKELLQRGYPTNPSKEYYFVYEIEQITNSDFINQKWDIGQLNGYLGGRGSANPFAVSIQELLNTKIPQ